MTPETCTQPRTGYETDSSRLTLATLDDGTELYLQPPDVFRPATYLDWNGEVSHALRQIVRNAHLTGICFVGPRGCGKSQAALELARLLRRPSYTLDGGPLFVGEDIYAVAVSSSANGKPHYVASPLLTAAFRPDALGILDDAAKCRPDALTALISGLDWNRRHLSCSCTLGRRIPVPVRSLPFVLTFQEHEMGKIPADILDRCLLFSIPPPPPDLMLQILHARVPETADLIRDAFVERLSRNAIKEVSLRRAILVLQAAQAAAADEVDPLTAASADRIIASAFAHTFRSNHHESH